MTVSIESPLILLVDDDQGLLALMQRRLASEGFRIATAASAAEAIASLTARRADLMLLDLKLPDMKWDDLLRELTARELTVPFIVITGQGDERAAVQVMKRGARDYLTKDNAFLDLLPSVVTRIVDQILQERRLADAESSLRESQRMLSTLMSNLAGMVYRCRNDRDWTMEFVSEGCFDLTGYCAADLLHNELVSYADLIHPDDRVPVWEAVQTALQRREPYRLLYRIRAASGDERWAWEQGRGVFDEAGGVVALEGFIADITDYKHAQQALQESEQRFRQLAENIQEVFWVLSPRDGRLLYVSPAYEKIFERTCGSLYAQPQSLLEMIHPADRDRAALLLSGEGDTVREEEYRLVRPDGSFRWICASTFPVRNEAGEIYRVVGVARDITDRKLAEDQLRHAQKMEAVGTLASGVAHDFNNLLTAILGYASLARKTLHKSHPAHQSLEMVENAIQQASGVAKALLTFSHKTATEKHTVNLRDVVTESLRLLRRVLPASIEIVDDLPANLDLWVNADANQIQQVLMNLAVNARDAMPNGGRLRIALRRAPAAPPRSGRPRIPARSRAVIVVEDTGAGMTEEVRSRVFEPFFTTKPRGQGTGLGMSIVHGIIADHQGRIRIDSEPEHGTRVTITLPQSAAPEEPVSRSAEQRPRRGHGELILVVEDDDQIRSIVTSSLRSQGYQVVQASNGTEALEVFEDHEGEIRLLVLDVDLPRMSGLTYLEKIRGLGLDLPAVLVTGSIDAGGNQPAGDNTRLLRKPFRMSELATVVAQLLAKSARKEEARHERNNPSPRRG